MCKGDIMQIGDTKKHVISLVVMLAVISVVFFLYGNGKRITFCDEIYTYNIVNSTGLTPYVVNQWMSGDDFKDALTQNEGDSYSQMIFNIKGDMVHPPLYYIGMYAASKLAGNNMSVWTGLAVNYLAYIGTACIVFLILKRLFSNAAVSGLGALGVMLTQCMISDGMLIRMYMVYTFFTALFAYANLLLREKRTIVNYMLLCVSVVGGFLTQYYFLFFAVLFFFFEFIYDIKDKNFKALLKYAAAMVVAAVIIQGLWSFWYTAISSSTHSDSILSNAKSIFTHLKKVFSGYQVIMAAVYQKAYKVFMVMIPLVIALLLYMLRKEKHSVLREYVIELAGVTFMYAAIVNILTPDYLASTRYYYADAVLLLVLYAVCVFGITEVLIKKLGGKKLLYCTGSGMLIAAINIVLLLTGYGVDYYSNAKDYDSVTDILEQYSDIPWVLGWDNSWIQDTAMVDYTIPDRIIPVSIYGAVDKGTFDGVDEFILIQTGDGSSELTTQKNLFNYVSDTDKNVEIEKIVSRGYVSYYHCTAVEHGTDKKVDEFLEDSKDTLWLVLNNDGWYEASELSGMIAADKVLYVDSNTECDTTGKYAEYKHVVILSSLYGDDIKDVGTYYMIGCTGNFYQSHYVGISSDRKAVIYSCDVVE